MEFNFMIWEKKRENREMFFPRNFLTIKYLVSMKSKIINSIRGHSYRVSGKIEEF